jgi:dTDP-4-amino-4,6-dideoxygalactose transaminase
LAASEVLVAVELREHRTVLDGARRRYEAILGARGALVRAIGTQVHYLPLHLQPFYRRRGGRPGHFPAAEDGTAARGGDI